MLKLNMARSGIARTRIFILREANRVGRNFSSLPATLSQHYYDYEYGYGYSNRINNHSQQLKELSASDSMKEEEEEKKSEACWIPHPRNGIYVPKGQEGMMDDVAEGAASFGQTYWLRNVDGVDKPEPDPAAISHN